MTQTHHLPLTAGLPALLLAPAVDRWVERFDAWVDTEHGIPIGW